MTRAPEPVLLLTVVLETVAFPVVERVPVMVVFPEVRVPAVEMFPAVICPVTPTPPETVKAPLLVVVLAVVLVSVVFPEAVKVEMIELPETSEPTVACPATPSPPDTLKAPVLVVVLAVVLVKFVSPLALSVPVMVVFPPEIVPDVLKLPAVTCPATPRPPLRVTPPVVVVVLGDVLVKAALPEKVGLLTVEIVPPVMLMLVPPVYMVVPTRIPFE